VLFLQKYLKKMRDTSNKSIKNTRFDEFKEGSIRLKNEGLTDVTIWNLPHLRLQNRARSYEFEVELLEKKGV
jgi:hypothetical protein